VLAIVGMNKLLLQKVQKHLISLCIVQQPVLGVVSKIFKQYTRSQYIPVTFFILRAIGMFSNMSSIKISVKDPEVLYVGRNLVARKCQVNTPLQRLNALGTPHVEYAATAIVSPILC
jgi:hypothetical protein